MAVSHEREPAGRTSRMPAKRALFEQLVADGVTSIFGNPGTTEQGFMDLLADYPSINYYLGLHEGVSIGMADAYARATRKPAFVELHITPGLGNAMGMMYNSKVAHSPLVVYVGQSPTTSLFQEPYLSGDLVGMAKPITKWAAEITHGADVPQALRRAFKVAQEPPQGPVLLSLPMDVLDVEAEMTVRPTTYVDWRYRPSQGAVEEAAAMLAAARSPILIVGNHVGLSGGQQAVVALAETLGAPILSLFTNEVNVPGNHPLYDPRGIQLDSAATAKTLAPHDLALVLGAPLALSIFPDSKGAIPEGTAVIHVDYDPWELGKNHPGELLIQADPGETALALREELLRRADQSIRRQWQERREAVERSMHDRREMRRRQYQRSWDAVPIAPHRLAAEVAAALPENGVLVEEAGTAGASTDFFLRPTEPWRWFRARGGGIGMGLPSALGVQAAYPDRPVVGLISDGASLMTITGLWTAAHHRLPVTFVMVNNRSYRRLKENLDEYRSPEERGRPYAHMDLTDPDLNFDKIAESFGVPGRQIERPEEIGPAIREALESGGPMLIDVIVSDKL
jgi:thiamine pyrophosphate-dependent acetolactate synthase large subunit-like protein